MRLNRFSIPVVVGFGSGVAILVFLSLLSYWELREHRKLDRVYETQRIAVSIQDVPSLMREAENGQHAYLLTGEERFLQSYKQAASLIPDKIETLQAVPHESPLPVELRNRLRVLVQGRLAQLHESSQLMMKSEGSKPALDFVHGDQGEQMMQEIQTIVRSLEQKAREGLHQRLDNEKIQDTQLRYIDLGGSLLAFGLIITAFLLLQKQVKKRKQVEAELRESEQRFQRIANATSDALWDWDIIMDSVWMGHGHRKIFGYSTEELHQASYRWWLDRIHPDDRGRVIEGINVRLTNGSVSWDGEYRYLRANGSYVMVADRAEIVRDQNGRPIRMYGGMVDITERKRAEVVLREMNVALEQQVKERTAALLMNQQRLRSLASQLTLAEQNERDRLASDLHDNLAQTLAFCKMKAEMLLRDFTPQRVRGVDE
ncbi:PAS domain-containing protein [Nitrospira sp. Nam74]